MTKNQPSENELRDRFQLLREEETALAPSFDQIITKARRQSIPATRRLITPVMIPLSAAALFFLFAIFLTMSGGPEPQSLSSSLPVLLKPDPERAPLFAGLKVQGEAHRYLSDNLLPFHLRISL